MSDNTNQPEQGDPSSSSASLMSRDLALPLLENQTNEDGPDRESTTAVPLFFAGLHHDFIVGMIPKTEGSFEGALTEHLRMSGIYWTVTALSLLLPWEEVDRLIGITTTAAAPPPATSESSSSSKPVEPILDWLFTCYDAKSGGFGGNSGQDGHMLYTLSAIQILALSDHLNDPRLERDKVIQFVVQLQQPDGSWAGDSWGEIDTRFTYCALSALSQLQALDQVKSLELAADYILACRNLDGGFGCVIGAESHAGQVFCCIGALAIAKALHRLKTEDDDGVALLGWWLAERQVDSGGLNGRPEKQADVCYSWWILSSLSILGQVPWISGDKLATYILKCQDDEDGGIADRPDDMPDIFHTFFGIAGLSLLGHLHRDKTESTASRFRQIDPVYALPTDVCQRLKMQGQVIVQENEEVDERLLQYDQYRLES